MSTFFLFFPGKYALKFHADFLLRLFSGKNMKKKKKEINMLSAVLLNDTCLKCLKVIEFIL